MRIKSILALVFLALMSSFLLTSCHTAEGFGVDMQEGGQAIQKAAIENNGE